MDNLIKIVRKKYTKMRGSGRGSHGGRQTNTALLRTAFVRADQSNSARRLQRDYNELIKHGQPLVGVAAKPLPNDLFTWHGNIRPPASSIWKDVVLHFEMTIPRDYPVSPPAIKLFNCHIPHPNVFGSTLCLDMI